ncbi:hypothetical protein GF314_01000 [bacterium]|nr:hypothetical protein [bacterium]
MPELPDVQVYKEYLDATSLHQEIEHVHLTAPELLDGVSRTSAVLSLRLEPRREQ